MTLRTDDFAPRWASPPGDTIRTALGELGWKPTDLAERMQVSDHDVAELLAGSMHLTVDLARRLSTSVGATVEFWMTREGRYRESQEWLSADSFVRILPMADMVSLGWIDQSSDWRDQVRACAAFFGRSTAAELVSVQGDAVAGARFRSTTRSPEDDAAVAAWLRKVEIEASSMSCVAWDPSSFQSLLPTLAALSRTSDPKLFVPELQRLCAERGVAVVVVKTPRRCPVSGVARTLASGTRLIGLSARYLADDHFWFTFFHEAGHLILHDADLVFVDDFLPETASANVGPEAEADDFASNALLPIEVLRGLTAKITPAQVHGMATRAGVSAGVVVGQLQHAGVLSFGSALNRLKHRYKWSGNELSRGTP